MENSQKNRDQNYGTAVVFYLSFFQYLSYKLSYSKQLY